MRLCKAMPILTAHRYEAFTEYQCPICSQKVLNFIAVPEPREIENMAAEPWRTFESEITCNHCGQLYPVVVEQQGSAITARMHYYPDVQMNCSQPALLERGPSAADIDVPPDPSAILINNILDIRGVMQNITDDYWIETLRRMIFIQLFAGLEAYLGDTLITQVLNNPTVMQRAVAGIRELKEKAITLPEIAADPHIVAKTVASHLRGLLYHNFAKVDRIWKITLGHSIFPDNEVKAIMSRAEPIRHDCVHRNGKDKEGNMRTEVNEAFIHAIDDSIFKMMSHIQHELQGW